MELSSLVTIYGVKNVVVETLGVEDRADYGAASSSI